MPPRAAASDGSNNRGVAHTAAVGKATNAEADPAAAIDVALERLVQCLTPDPHAWAQRQSLLSEHIQCLRQAWKGFHDIRIQPFGSSLSGLCLADSDIDLGLFGSMHQVDLEAITPQQAKKLLYSVLGAIQRAGLADGKVQTVMGARVPVLKYTCALSGLDCDVSIQSSGALVKANFMALLNRHCPNLSPLYRLVKLWASAHDLNDASRSTFNSTSLLYMTVFFLQTRQLVPPLCALVDPAQLNDPFRRPLQAHNKWLWDRPQHLTQLLAAATQRMDAWVSMQQRQRGSGWARHSLYDLLQGLFAFYSDLFMDWVLGKRREQYADLWEGQLTSHHIPDEQLGKDYLFNLQDPFDPVDCPARAIGTMSKDNNGVGVLITYLLSCSHSAMQRLYNPSSSSGSSSSRPLSTRHRSSSDGGSAGGLQHRLCQCLAWLFGPQAVLLLSPAEPVEGLAINARVGPPVASSGAVSAASSVAVAGARGAAAAGVAISSNGSSSSSRVEWQVWAAQPFDVSLAAQLRSRHQQQEQQQQRGGKHGRGGRGRAESPATQFRWLVSCLAAALEPEHGPCVLCLEHLSLLNKRIDAGLLSGPFGEALAAGAVRRREDLQQQREKLEGDRLVWQRRLLPGPPLPQPDPGILQLYDSFTSVLKQQWWQPHEDKPPRGAASLCKAVRDAARQTVTQVAQRMQALAAPHHPHHHHHSHHHHGQQQQQQQAGQTLDNGGPPAAAAADEAEGIGGFGLEAVLEQHGFTPVLQRWGFLTDSVLWHKLLPLPEHLQQQHQQQQQLHHSQQAQQPPHHPQQQQQANPQTVHPAADGTNRGTGVFQPRVQLQSQGLASGTPMQAAGSSRQEAQPAAAGRAVSGSQFLQQLMSKQQQQQQHRVQQQQRHHVQQITVAGVTDHFQQMALDMRTAMEAAAASSSSSAHSRARGAPGQQQHHLILQHGQVSSPLHIQQQQRHQHKQQSNGPAGTSPQAAGVRVVARPQRHQSHSPAAAAVSVPIDIAEPTAGPALAMHGDGLAESFCRQLQEKISSPPVRPQPGAVYTPQGGAAGQQQGGKQGAKHGKQQQEQQQHPAAAMLGAGRYDAPGSVSGGSSYGSSKLSACSPPAAGLSPPANLIGKQQQGRRQHQHQQQQQHPATQLLGSANASGLAAAAVPGSSLGGSSSSHAVRSPPAAGTSSGASPLANKAQLRVRQASYKVHQLQQQIDKAEREASQKQAALDAAEQQIEAIMGPVGPGGEQQLDQDSRQALLGAKQTVMRNAQSVKMMSNNVRLWRLKLPAAQKELRQAEAAAAASGP